MSQSLLDLTPPARDTSLDPGWIAVLGVAAMFLGMGVVFLIAKLP